MQWQTRTLASFVAATVPTEEGVENPLLREAQRIGLPADAELAQPAASEPQPGSYEKFMMAFSGRLG